MLDRALATYGRSEVSDAKDAAELRDVQAQWRAYVAATARVPQLSRAGRDAEAETLLVASQARFDKLTAALASFAAANDAAGRELDRESGATYASARRDTILAVLIALGLAVGIAILISRRIVGGVRQVLVAAQASPRATSSRTSTSLRATRLARWPTPSPQ